MVSRWDEGRRHSQRSPTLGAKDSSSISGSTALAAGRYGGVLICAVHPRTSYRQAESS